MIEKAVPGKRPVEIEAAYCDIEAGAFAELAENSSNKQECGYYRDLEQIWRRRADALRRDPIRINDAA